MNALAPREFAATIPCADCGHAPWGHGVKEPGCYHLHCTCAGYDDSQGVLL